MRKAAYIFRRQDISIIKHVLGNAINDYDYFASSLGVICAAIENGISRINLVEAPDSFINNVRDIHLEADRLARAYDGLLSSQRSIKLAYEVETLGWDYLNAYYLAYTVKRTNLFSKYVASLIKKKYQNVLVVHVSSPQDYYFDSALTRTSLLKNFENEGLKVDLINVAKVPPFKEHASNFSVNKESILDKSVLVHLPTCFYDADFHQKRLNSTYQDNFVDLESPYFDVSVGGKKIHISYEKKMNIIHSRYKNYVQAIRKVNEFFYSELGILDLAKKVGQVDRCIARSLSQCNFFDDFKDTASAIKIYELSCHDTGILGPLFSLANIFQAKVNVWPHSKFINIPLPLSDKTIRHSIVRQTNSFLTLNLTQGQSFVNKIVPPTSLTSNLKRLLIVLNEFDDHALLPIERLTSLKNLMNRIILMANQRSYEIKIRFKPHHDISRIFKFDKIESAGGQIEDWLSWPSLCLGIGTPSSALYHFYEKGVFSRQLMSYRPNELEEFLMPDGIVLQRSEYKFSDIELSNIFDGHIE